MKTLFHQLTRRYRPGNLPNVAVFSSARSGSSWLMELIATQPGFKFVDEPLHPDNLIRCQLASNETDAWRRVLPNPVRQSQFQTYFETIENNQLHIGEPRFLSEFYRMNTNRIVFKILRAKDLMPWFENTFGWQIIYLIRHPLATNLSRKKFPRLELFLENEEFTSKYLTPDQFAFSNQIVAKGSPLEKGVLDWCLQNIPALRRTAAHRWLNVFYEDLVCQPEQVIEQLADTIGLPQPEKILRRLSTASGSTIQSDDATRSAFEAQKTSNDFLLNKWRAGITQADEEKAFLVLDEMDIHIYGRGMDKPCPSMAKSQ